MYGVVTRNQDEVSWPEFDVGFYEVKDVTGRVTSPIQHGINMVSCFGDTKRAEAEPGLVPVSESGERATREQPYFDWGYICPTRESYVTELLELIESCGAVNSNVRLDDVGFPRNEYCYCEHCADQFAQSEYTERGRWRAGIITSFVKRAVSRIPGRTYLTLYPDPYPGHLYDRAGLDVAALAALVDEFVIPIYDMAYATTYWIEVIAAGFSDLLSAAFSVELYAVGIEPDRLVHAAEVAAEYSDSVWFAYDATAAREVITRLTA